MAKKKSVKAAKPSTKRAAKKKVAASKASRKPTTSAAKKAVKKSPSGKTSAERVPPKLGFEPTPKTRRERQIRDRVRQSAAEQLRIKTEMDANWDALCLQRIQARAALEKWWPKLSSHPGVTGCHVGLKRFKGKIAFPLCYCIRVHVTQKISEKELTPALRLPDNYCGIDVDLWVVNYRSLAGTGLPKVFEPTLMGGIAIAPKSNTSNWGTLGFCVSSNGKPVLLTNWHVAGDAGSNIVQPPSQNVPTGSAEVGTVLRAVVSGIVDAAVVSADGGRPTQKSIRLGNGFLNGPFREGELTFEDVGWNRTEVFKIGAASGGGPSRLGVVKLIDGTPDVPGLGTLSQQIIVTFDTPEVTGGDSGSLLIKPVVENSVTVYEVVGLVTAALDGGYGLVANHWKIVRDQLFVRLN